MFGSQTRLLLPDPWNDALGDLALETHVGGLRGGIRSELLASGLRTDLRDFNITSCDSRGNLVNGGDYG